MCKRIDLFPSSLNFTDSQPTPLMKTTFEVSTEGVLILSTQNALKTYFSDKEFDYRYPEGLMSLINLGIASIIATDSGDELKVVVTDEAIPADDSFKRVGQYHLRVGEGDSIYVLSHAAFTQICDWHKGDIAAYNFFEEPQQTSELRAGEYEVTFYARETELDEEVEEEEEYELEVLIHFKPSTQGAPRKVETLLRI